MLGKHRPEIVIQRMNSTESNSNKIAMCHMVVNKIEIINLFIEFKSKWNPNGTQKMYRLNAAIRWW